MNEGHSLLQELLLQDDDVSTADSTSGATSSGAMQPQAPAHSGQPGMQLVYQGQVVTMQNGEQRTVQQNAHIIGGLIQLGKSINNPNSLPPQILEDFKQRLQNDPNVPWDEELPVTDEMIRSYYFRTLVYETFRDFITERQLAEQVELPI